MADLLPYFMSSRSTCFENSMRGTDNYPVYFVPSGRIIFDIIHNMGNIPHGDPGVVNSIFHPDSLQAFIFFKIFQKVIL